MVRSGSPWTLAASTKSAVRRLSVCERTALARPAQAVTERMMASTNGLELWITLAITMTRGSPGMVRKMSVTRITSESTSPPV